MSTYYDFYLAEQTEDKKYSLIGPYKKTKEGMEIYALLSRSGGFMCNVDDLGLWKLDAASLDEEAQKKFVHKYDETHTYCSASVVSLNELQSIAAADNCGLRHGYCLKSKLKLIAENDYKLEKYDVELKTADEVAEMTEKERLKYARTAFVETNSVGYIANEIVQACGALTDYWHKDEEYYIICGVS